MAHLRDAAVLLVVIAAPAAFYVLDLGRHSDDWWFYRHMLSDGLRPAEALQRAQLSVAAERRWSNPYFWAGFVLLGDWL